jgi:hypothetical protein
MKKKNPIESRSEYDAVVEIEFESEKFKYEIEKSEKVCMGGGFLTHNVRLDNRSIYRKTTNDEDYGFRICRTVQDSSK